MRLLAAGRDADVFELSADTVLRRYRDASKAAAPEADVMRHAREHGLPVPEVRSVEGPDIVMQRLVGPTMATAVMRRPWLLRRTATQLAALHRDVHAVSAPAGLRQVGEGTALLHLDLHPDNVMLTANGPVIIDWANAAAGPPALDVADVWLLMSSVAVDGRAMRRNVGERLARRFATAFVDAADVDYRGQLRAAAERRLTDDNMGPDERARITRLVAEA